MPQSYDDRLKDYVDVKTRVAEFYQKHPDGRLVTAELYMSPDPDGVVRVWGKALAYRTPDDPLPGVGWSYMAVPGSTPYTRGSEAENVETSAWGRAIGALGIGIARSIATSDEIANKDDQPGESPPAAVERDPTGGLIGIAEIGKSTDTSFELMDSNADGIARLGFRLKSGRTGFKVIAEGDLAGALMMVSPDVIGKRVICWGAFSDETFQPKGKQGPVTYKVLHLTRIQTPDWTLPADAVAPGQEAFDLTEEALT